MPKKYNAAFSAPLVRTPWDSHTGYPPSLYCIRGTTYDRYDWTGTSLPWIEGTPDGSGTLNGTGIAAQGLLGHWDLPSAWKNSVDGAFCTDVNTVYLFKNTECIYLSLNYPPPKEPGFPAAAARTPRKVGTTAPQPIADQFGHKGIFPLRSVDAAFPIPGGKKIWFFGGNKCYLINASTRQPDPAFTDRDGNPAALAIDDTNAWPGLPAAFTHGLTWAAPVVDANGVIQARAYLVTGTTWHPVATGTMTAQG